MTAAGPTLLVLDDAAQAAAYVGQEVVRTLAQAPATVIGLATGATMRPVHAWLVAAHRRGDVSFAAATSFNLDEYVGLEPQHPCSFAATMRTALFDHADFAPGHIHLLDGGAPDLAAEAERYEAAMGRAGWIGLQLLGIGRNGHIGFNEPGSALESVTRVVSLSPETRAANRAAFGAETVPERALTVGIGTILRASRILLLATGPEKADAVSAAWAGPIRPQCPASALHLHPAACFVCDRQAASAIDQAFWTRSTGR